MKKIILILLVILGSFSVFGMDLKYGGEIDTNSEYIWRGYNFGRGFMIQPSAFITAFNTTLSLWGSLDAERTRDQIDGGSKIFHEMDITLSYLYSIKNFSVTPKVLIYIYPEEWGKSDAPTLGEFGVNLSYAIKALTLYTDHYIGFELTDKDKIVDYNGAYYGDLGMSLSYEIIEKLTGITSMDIGWGDKKFNQSQGGTDKFKLCGINVGTSLTYNMTDNLYIRQHVNFAHFLSETYTADDTGDDTGAATLKEKPLLFTFGLAFGGSF